jgi:hypothetical protein
MTNDESNSAADAESIAPQEHLAVLAKHRSRVLFETLVMRLGGGHSNVDFVRFFDSRCTINQVVDWRRNRARIPGWAWTYLGVLLRARAAADLDFARQTDAADRQRRANNIAKFNARRFAPQTTASSEKEKAG